MTKTTPVVAACTCGQVAIEATGAPIFSAACYCDSCRKAAGQFEQAPGAPRVLNTEGGVDYCLYRKDRVAIMRGGDRLQEHRLTPEAPTRRATATCCNAPMFLDYTPGHWLTFYRDRLPKDARPIEMRVMTKDLPAGSALPAGAPAYPTFPPKAMIRLLTAWAATGFRRPKLSW